MCLAMNRDFMIQDVGIPGKGALPSQRRREREDRGRNCVRKLAIAMKMN